ncbi:MAG: hypothetical protein R3346_04890, partial [Candidatus Spechtbacterales bacterium]|nr:hypothetical protein [Candidatus Spechtbacterales bacterium]
EDLLGINLPYYKRAAIIIRQAEHGFERPMFRQERGYIISEEYEAEHGEYKSPYTAGAFAGEWGKCRVLCISDKGELTPTVRNFRPPTYLIGFNKHSFLKLPMQLIPNIWVPDYSHSQNAHCEFPPGVTIEEMKSIMEALKEQAHKLEESRERLLGATRHYVEDNKRTDASAQWPIKD